MIPPMLVPCPPMNFVAGMHNHVGAVLDRAQQDRRGDRVVNDEWDTVFVCHSRQPFYVSDVSRRIANALAVNSPRIFVDQLFDIFRDDRSPRTGK